MFSLALLFVLSCWLISYSSTWPVCFLISKPMDYYVIYSNVFYPWCRCLYWSEMYEGVDYMASQRDDSLSEVANVFINRCRLDYSLGCTSVSEGITMHWNGQFSRLMSHTVVLWENNVRKNVLFCLHFTLSSSTALCTNCNAYSSRERAGVLVF